MSLAKTGKVLNVDELEEDDHIEAQCSKIIVGESADFSVPPIEWVGARDGIVKVCGSRSETCEKASP